MAITSTKVKVYSDSGCTQLVATVNGTTSASQTLSVTGLNPSTNYWAIAEATDDNGLTGYSVAQTFSTSAATYVWSGTGVAYSSLYSVLDVDIAVSCSGATFTSCGIEFCTSSDFSGSIISGHNTTSPATDFVDEVTGFAENTTYYYRYVATSNEYGTQYYAPTGTNSITTHYAEPTLSISADNITDTTMRVICTYTGNYPATNLSATYGVSGSGSSSSIQLEQTAGTQYATLSGLQPNTAYYLEITADYYTGEVTDSATVTTLTARPVITVNGVSNITPSSADISITIS